MPSLRHRPSGHRRAAPFALAVVVALAAACSAGPVSDVTTAPETTPPSTGPATEAPVSDAPPTAAPTDPPATPTPTPAPPTGPPDKPTAPTFAIVSEQPLAGGAVRETHRITWKAPQGEATSFKIYGVKPCLRASKKNHGTPCVVRGMRIPRDALALLAEAPGAARTIDVAWQVPKSGRQPYAAVLIRAANAKGDSIFTIVHAEDVCWRC